RAVGDPQARRARQGVVAGQAQHDRARGVQVDPTGGDGPAHHDETGRRGGAGNPRHAEGSDPVELTGVDLARPARLPRAPSCVVGYVLATTTRTGGEACTVGWHGMWWRSVVRV